MRDRTPTKALENGALRYGVYAEDGSLLRHEYLALEDDPADPGSPRCCRIPQRYPFSAARRTGRWMRPSRASRVS